MKKTVSPAIPGVYTLHPAFPNQFNPVIIISYELLKKSYLSITICNLTWRQVAELVNGFNPTSAGFHQTTWDGTNDSGQQMSTGVYLYRIKTEVYNQTRKMVLLR